MLRLEDVEHKEEHLRQRINQLSNAHRKRFYHIAKKKLRDPDTYAVLVYFFMVGVHHIYLGYYLRGAINLIVVMAGFLLMFAGHTGIGFLLMAIVPIIEVWDLFRSQIIVQDRNNQIMERLLDELDYKMII